MLPITHTHKHACTGAGRDWKKEGENDKETESSQTDRRTEREEDEKKDTITPFFLSQEISNLLPTFEILIQSITFRLTAVAVRVKEIEVIHRYVLAETVLKPRRTAERFFSPMW